MAEFFAKLLEMIKTAIDWYMSTDLPRATMEFINNTVTYTIDNFVPLMWEYYYTIFGGVVPPVV